MKYILLMLAIAAAVPVVVGKMADIGRRQGRGGDRSSS